MSRTCGITFALAISLFFPFPNVLVAPGYSVLPDIHVPTIRQTAAELPPPWNRRAARVLNESRWFFNETSQHLDFLARWARHILIQTVAFSDVVHPQR